MLEQLLPHPLPLLSHLLVLRQIDSRSLLSILPRWLEHSLSIPPEYLSKHLLLLPENLPPRSQTLLEITEGIDKSNVILQEVTGRYEESVESREVIEDYYNSRFISTAKLLSFFVEESPEVLNTTSEFYHSVYDKNGECPFWRARVRRARAAKANNQRSFSTFL